MAKFIWNGCLIGQWKPSLEDDVDYERDGDVGFVCVDGVGMIVFQSFSEMSGIVTSHSVLVPGAVTPEHREINHGVWEVDTRPLDAEERDMVRPVVEKATRIKAINFW
ncbi:MAG: hypothetical protein U9Q03_03180 [Patescibacteria group bacterium]|nr:hypothetical protein [Patescibacteria group bacterium]